MKTLQTIIMKLLCLGILLAGCALIYRPSSELYTIVAEYTPSSNYRWIMRVVVGVIAGLIGLVGLLPCGKGRKKKTITFIGTHGEQIIQLDPIEASMSRVIGKMPEVKRIAVSITPSEDGQRVQVTANVVLVKEPGTSVRQISDKVTNYSRETAKNILGVREVTGVTLNVSDIVLRKGSVPKPVEVEPEPVEVEPEPVEEHEPETDVDETPEPEVGATEPEEIEQDVPYALEPLVDDKTDESGDDHHEDTSEDESVEDTSFSVLSEGDNEPEKDDKADPEY